MSKIIVIGLGPGSPGHLTEEARRYLAGHEPLFFRTLKHPAARLYARKRVGARSFDYLYQKYDSFEKVYRSIAGRLIGEAQKNRTVCYAVPGHPAIGEASVELLKRISSRCGIKLQMVAGLSFLEPLFEHLQLDPLDGVTVIDALAIEKLKEPSLRHLVLAQVYSRSLASRIKLKLLELYPPEHPVTVVRAAGLPAESSRRMPLFRLDHRPFFDHYTTLYLPPFKGGSLGDLTTIMARLRADDGCPWDRQQTNRSLRQYLIEEAYEVIAAIDRQNDALLKEELGDVLLQVIFHSQIAREENRFDIYQVIEAIAAKLIRRHPHVFGRERADNADQVKALWEEIKSGERNEDNKNITVKVDHALPALLKAYKLQRRAAELGFDWPCVKGPLEKAREELSELEEACAADDRLKIEEEVGDYLFTVVNIARFLGVNPELALGKTIGKFVNRFQYVVDQARKSGRPLDSFSLEKMDQWWEEAKKIRKMPE